MVKVISKGTVLLQEVSTIYTAIAQLSDLSFSGYEVETFDCTTLDGAVGKAYAPTGYTEPGEVSLGGYYDPVLASHTNLRDLCTTPVETNFRITYADAGVTQLTFAVAGVSWGSAVAMSDGLKFSSTLKLTGLPVYA